MKIVKGIADMQQLMKQEIRSGKEIGFVPTMGYLHDGHLKLVEEAREANDIVVLSIFVNPLQFGPNEDFEKYPRDLKRDERLAELVGVDFLFYPDANDMYPDELSIDLKVQRRTDKLCGRSRPGHFDGVATVLMKLFNIVMPDRAYFGMKDAQQVAVVQGMIDDFNIPVELVPVDIVREEDGLAKSSRNVYLSEKERKQAPALYESLKMAKDAHRNGKRDPKELVRIVTGQINTETDGVIDYVEILSYPDLEPVEVVDKKALLAVAVQFGKARLIDNILL